MRLSSRVCPFYCNRSVKFWKFTASYYTSFTSLGFCWSHCSCPPSYLSALGDFTDTRIIRTPWHVPLMSVLTGLHCIFGNRPLHSQSVQRTKDNVNVRFTWSSTQTAIWHCNGIFQSGPYKALCHAVFKDRFIFRALFSRENRSFSPSMCALYLKGHF